MIKFILSLARHFDVEVLPVTLTDYPCVAATPAFSLILYLSCIFRCICISFHPPCLLQAV